MKSLRILLLGDKSVGKSEMLYKQTVTCDDLTINLEILDYSKSAKENLNVRLEDIKSQIIWAQAYVVVYSICDVKSFLTAQYYLGIITKIKGITNINVPIVLLGNKRDLEIGRKVGLDEGRSAAIKFGSQFYEISAAENYVGVTLAFHGLLREARSYYDRSLGTSTYHSGQAPKKLSLNSVTRAFGAVFGNNNKNSPSCNGPYSVGSITRDGKINHLLEPMSNGKQQRRSLKGNGNPSIINTCKHKKDPGLDPTKQSPPIASL
ncbi:ras-related and estrogen-regulated growth inhibitor-like protein isoform X2 [Brevipalpus obovatus]|uniref:ras-related and estrogen-regulated growth inhibitor-like protein isoform X2 n=1 Tax=Brevipalpus obovatus TaxID=246614 RepID=UPI003D9FA551